MPNHRIDLPRLYPIMDLGYFASSPDPVRDVCCFAEGLLAGGATLLQLRDKTGEMRRFLSCARELRRITRGRAQLIINDRADLAIACDADGVHLGQDDPSPKDVQKIFDSLGHVPSMGQAALDDVDNVEVGAAGRHSSERGYPHLIGFSTHNLEQVKLADSLPIDYLAVGPVFPTSSKANPDPVIGVEGVRQARAETSKPLVAIGGITRKNCRQVIEAGAESVAVISDLLDSPAKAVEEFIRVLG